MERLQNPKMRQRGLSDNESICRIEAVCKDHPWRKWNIIERLAVKLRPVFATLLISCLAVLFGVPASGQNVTISPSSGHLIAGLTYTGETGFDQGWSSLWRHNQLPLTLLVSDKADLTPSGVLKDPAGNISLDKSQNLYVIDGGESVSTRMSISLPKGYRFTGYRIVLLNNINGKEINNAKHVSMSKRLYETGSTFDYEKPLASTDEMGSTNDETKDYVIERTSRTETDMGNNLYFYFWHESEGYYGATIKSIELYFTAQADFEAHGVPGTPDEIISDGVNMVGSEFTTGKLDLGIIQPNTRSGETYYSYNYENVIDLTAKNWLYQEDAVTADKKLPKTAGKGNIQVLQNDGQLYYALGNGTYYIETPTETTNQNGKSIPLGYRITGAQIKAHYGTQAESSPITYDGTIGTISYTVRSGLIRRTTYYLQTDGTWNTSPQTKWLLTKERRLKSGNTYLYVQKDGSEYIAYGTPDISQASNFSVSNGEVMWGDYYLSFIDNSRARFRTSYRYAADWNDTQGSATNPAYKPSNFKLELYGTNKGKVEETADITSSNSDDSLSVSGLNNDAVKFTISGLDDGTKALITYDLTMEQLNPFINTLDIVCHSKEETGPTITQTFTSNDFQVAGGKFNFYIPADFADANNNCRFTFENLKSKYMDETYDNGTSGNARNFFVKSDYYNKYGDGMQYEAPADAPSKDKVMTAQCGNEPFKYNNAADLEASGNTADATTLEEYPFSEARYTAKDGSGTSTGKQGTFTENIEVRVNDPAKDCYLFTGDETRYHIAPTTAMEHRAYAFYLMQIDLQVKEYDAYCRMTKLYDATCYDGNQVKPMYGGVFEAYRKGHAGDKNYKIPSDSAFLSVSMMVKALKEAEQRGEKFSADQVLYLDYTNLYSVMVESKDSMAAMKAKLNPNCLIFFPQTTFYDVDNYVQKTPGGGFRACRNIVITDKQPFYSPYKISVPKENYAKYTRNITVSKYGKAQNATLMLPFELSIDGNGVHTNSGEAGDQLSFSVNTLQKENCISSVKDGDEINESKGWYVHFVPYTSSTHTEANVPYMIHVTDAPTDKDVSFTALQYGSDIMPTQVGQDGTITMKETCTGTYDGHSITLTPIATYSGTQVDKNKNKCFYWGNNVFNSSWTLSSRYNAVKVMPFRAWLACEGISPAKAATLHAVFGENTTSATGISNVEQSSDELKIEGTVGALTIVSPTDRTLDIRNTQGMLIKRVTLRAGERDITSLPSGIYLVAGKKVIVK